MIERPRYNQIVYRIDDRERISPARAVRLYQAAVRLGVTDYSRGLAPRVERARRAAASGGVLFARASPRTDRGSVVNRAAYRPAVFLDRNSRPLIVFRKGRKKYYAVGARDADIALLAFDTLRDLRPLERNGSPYPIRKAASFWLNRDFRAVTKRARLVLRGLVSRRANDLSAGSAI